MRKGLRLLLLASVISAGSHRSPAQWIQTDGPEGGYIWCLAEDDLFLYAGTWGPVFRMSKADTTWSPLPPVAPWLPGATCLLSTGTGLVAGAQGPGVFRSTDHGITWQRWISGLDGAESIGCFAQRGNVLFAGTNRGVYLSADGGANWTATNAGLDFWVQSLLVRDSCLFAGTFGSGVYRSTDYGAHWSVANNGLTGSIVWSFAVLDTCLYVGTWGMEGVHRSTDNGLTWKVFEDGPYKVPNVNALVVMGTTILAGTVRHGVYRSRNGGPWELLSDGPASVVSFHVAGSQIFAGTFDGVYSSPDTGDTWNAHYSGLKGTSINFLLREGRNLFAGGGDLFLSVDDGASWTKTHGYTQDIKSLVVVGSDYFAGHPWGVSRSTDGGINWFQAGPWDGGGAVSLAVIADGTGKSHLFAGTDSNGVFLSTDRGLNWTPVNSGLTDNMVHCLAAMDTILFAATRSGVFRSTDRGTDWTPVNWGLTDTDVRCFAPSGMNLYAGTADSGVFLTTDGGNAWGAVNNGLTSLDVLCLAARGTRVMAGTSANGVFFSENSGASWARADTGLRPLPILALELGDSTAFAAPRGYGVWRRPLQEMLTAVNGPSGAQPAFFNLGQNYPNPFNPTTVIRYQLPVTSEVKLVVFDILGREVALLVNERKALGSYDVKFDASGLSSGVYLYRLTAGSFVQTCKMVVLR